MWSMCACVITMDVTLREWRASTAMISSMLSPGSITTASRDCSSPKIEQLHCNIPTGRISWIIRRLYTLLMGEPLTTVLLVAMRWLHFVSMAALLGGLMYARLVMLPAIEATSAD